MSDLFEDSVKTPGVRPSSLPINLTGELMTDPLLGRAVEIFSINGIRYEGIVMVIRDRGEMGELFELGSHDDPTYHRLVYVTDRLVQVHCLPKD